MSVPVRIHFLDMDSSEAVEGKILERARKLEKLVRFQRCEVWLSSPRAHHRHGPLFRIRVFVALPDEEVDVDFQPEEEDVYVAIRQAFDATRRRIQDAVARRAGRVKTHPRKTAGAAAPARRGRRTATSSRPAEGAAGGDRSLSAS